METPWLAIQDLWKEDPGFNKQAIQNLVIFERGHVMDILGGNKWSHTDILKTHQMIWQGMLEYAKIA